MDYKNPKFIISAVIIALLLWGFIGGIIANDIKNTCDIGFWELCWTWHQNFIGAVAEVFS